MKFPDINFVTADVDEIQKTALELVESLIERKLERADPLRVFLNSLLAIIIQQRILIDQTAKMNLLAYATGDYLDHLGLLVGVERLGASAASASVKLTLSTSRSVATSILIGTRFTPDNKTFFALDETVTFARGETVKYSTATCTTTGEAGNGFAVGEINKIVDPRPYLKAVENITVSTGGMGVEDDDSFRERIHEAPEGYSTAGSAGAYKFHAKSVSVQIADVSVVSPAPGYVDIYVIRKDGQTPDAALLNKVKEHLNADTVRPLTDFVNVYAAETVSFAVMGKYYIAREDQTQAEQIVARAEQAIKDYIAWQCAVIGRDINPDELIYRMKAAGVKRVYLTTPVFKVLEPSQAASNSITALTYGGLEDG